MAEVSIVTEMVVEEVMDMGEVGITMERDGGHWGGAGIAMAVTAKMLAGTVTLVGLVENTCLSPRG